MLICSFFFVFEEKKNVFFSLIVDMMIKERKKISWPLSMQKVEKKILRWKEEIKTCDHSREHI